mgnify:FL=1
MVYIKSSSEQTLLLPTNLRDIIPKDHICFLIEDVINELNFKDFDEKVEGPGNPSYHPRIILKIILNGICERITSTRKLEKLTIENIVFRYLAENLNPDFHTIALFRKQNSELIKQSFLQTVEIGKRLDMINFNKLYLDGMKTKANASKSKTFSKQEIEFLSGFVDKYLSEMDKIDEEENVLYGNEDGQLKIPEHLTNKRKLKEKISQMMKDMKKSKWQLDKAKEKIQKEEMKRVNLTDMDSKMMKMKKGIHYEQAYNCQLLVEDKSEMIASNYISDNAGDVGQTVPSMEKFKQEQKETLDGKEVFQDNAYSCSKTAEYYEKQNAIAYIPDNASTKELHGKDKKIGKFDYDNFKLDFKKNQVKCPKRHKLKFVRRDEGKDNGNWTNVYRGEKCKNCKFREECIGQKVKRPYKEVRINPLMRKIRLRFKTKKGLKKYNKRFHKGEVAQAHIEHNLGYREFKMRGIDPCENELNLVSTAYNLIKIKKYLEKKGKLRLNNPAGRLFYQAVFIYLVNYKTACEGH